MFFFDGFDTVKDFEEGGLKIFGMSERMMLVKEPGNEA